DSRGHFFAAAAHAMRRIMVDLARRKGRSKHGGDHARQNFDLMEMEAPVPADDILGIDAALSKLETVNDQAARLIHLRYFGGLTLREVAEIIGVSPRKADQI